jgi:membrane dipeptidase
VKQVPVFDGHNDVLLRLWLKKSGRAHLDFVEGDGVGHIDLPRLKKAGMIGGLYAIFPPPVSNHLPDDDDLNPPQDGELSHAQAKRSTLEMADLMDAIIAASGGGVRKCLTVSDIRSAIKQDAQAMVFHIEGAEAITRDLGGLEMLHARGLRSLGPVWSRPNWFGDGVPFRFPSSPDTGRGLTDAGKTLVMACNELRILVDCSHMTEKAFWDTANTSTAPLVASHSNVHAICASSRNLTDDQLRAIGERRGLVGLNFATGFLRPDGYWTTDTAIEIMLRHLDHMLKVAGEDCVGFGSDFDGARIPRAIGDVAGLPILIAAMQKHGYGDELISKIASENWLRVLDQTWRQA